MRDDLDKILHQQKINIISLLLVTLFLYFKKGIYGSKYLSEKIEEIKKNVENNREIIKHFKVEQSIKKLKFFHYFISIYNKEIIIDYSDFQSSKKMLEACIPFNEEIGEICIDKKSVEKLGLIFAFELDDILKYQNLDFDLLPYKMGKKFAKDILNIIGKEHNVDPFEIINFAFASFVSGLLNGFFEKYREIDKRGIEEISKNVYIFKSGEEYLNTLKRMLESIHYIDLKSIIRNTISLIEGNKELFKKIENYGRILGYNLGEYLDNNPEKIYKIYNKYTEIIIAP